PIALSGGATHTRLPARVAQRQGSLRGPSSSPMTMAGELAFKSLGWDTSRRTGLRTAGPNRLPCPPSPNVAGLLHHHIGETLPSEPCRCRIAPREVWPPVNGTTAHT